ncbi:MAG TPA: YlxR family protein [Chthonomonadaceae bacterium]|nr:YlxR family protein [Chthonomonadaceae bacterium]
MACRTADAKRTLLRVVRQSDGVVAYDAKGKMPGRGAYVCAQASCIALARKQRKLERSLNVPTVTEELFQELALRAAESDGAPAMTEPASPAAVADAGAARDAAS